MYVVSFTRNQVVVGELEFLIDSGITAGILTREKSRIAYSFPKVRPHAPDTVQTPSPLGLSAWRRFQLRLWDLGARMRDHDIKYAIKTGAATAVLAAPAFFEVTRPTFMEYRGEWALISVSAWCPADTAKVETQFQFFVVMSPTIGAVRLVFLSFWPIRAHMTRRPISLACIASSGHCERIMPLNPPCSSLTQALFDFTGSAP